MAQAKNLSPKKLLGQFLKLQQLAEVMIIP
jgi:hypothetical protein